MSAFLAGIWLVIPVMLSPALTRATTTPDHWYGGFALPVIDGGVHAILPWRGGIVIGGSFNQAGGARARNIACWDGALWHSLGDGLDGRVYSLVEFRGDLIAAGVFPNAGGIAVNNIARWDGVAWSPLAGGLIRQAGFTEIRALTVHTDALIAGGNFDHAGATDARGVARWDGGAWSALGEGLDDVLSLAVFQDMLYAGRRVAPGTAGALELWSGSSWSPVDGVSAGTRYALALAPYRGRLIVAGQFDAIGSTAARNCAAWDGTRWDAMGSGPYSSVQALVVRQDTLVAGGWVQFGTNLDFWDGVAWRSQVSGLDGAVQSLAANGAGLWVGGYFEVTSQDGVPGASGLALGDGGGWRQVGSWDATMHGLLSPGSYVNVTCLARHRDGVVAGGAFRHAGAPPGWTPAGPIAFWDGARWNALPEMPPSADVHALLSWGDTLVAGGRFLLPSDPDRHVAVARLEGDHWSPLDSLGLEVDCLARFRGELYASGQPLTYVSGPPAVYRWDGTRWLSQGVVRGSDPMVGAMLVHEDRLLVAGHFTGIGQATSSGLVAWDGAQWIPVADLPDPYRVSSLTVHEGRLTVGGSFPGTSVMLCDGALVQPLGPQFGEVTSLASIRGHLFAGVRGGRETLVEWDGSAWVPLEGGTNGSITSLLAKGGRLYAGGMFTMAGARSSFGIARWDGLADEPELPEIVTFETGVPNPFRRSTTMAYLLGAGARVRAAVLDLGGREIAVLDEGQRAPGIHSLTWDGLDDRGRLVRPGVYLVRARIEGSPDRIWRVIRLE
jgi:hypothetical protein